MKIIHGRPPNWDKINAAFHIENQPVIIAFGDTIFNPMNGKVPRTLIEHEFVHCAQQTTDEDTILTWWDNYIADPKFRFDMELPAHQAEFNFYRKHHPGKRATQYLDHCAAKFASPIYGNIVTKAQARHAILTGEGI